MVIEILSSEVRWRSAGKLCDIFSLKLCIFQSMVDIVKPFLWKIDKTLFFNMVQPDHSKSCPISTVYCSKLGTKLHVFSKKKKWEFYYGFWYFGNISSILSRSMHGSSWGDFFTQPTMVGQKQFNLAQPNPHGFGWVRLNT